MDEEIVSELIHIQHDVLRIVTINKSAYPLIKKYKPNIEKRIEQLKKMEGDRSIRILIDFMGCLLDDGTKKDYILIANLLESFLLDYSRDKQNPGKRRGRPKKEKEGEKIKRGRGRPRKEKNKVSPLDEDLEKKIAENKSFLNEVCS